MGLPKYIQKYNFVWHKSHRRYCRITDIEYFGDIVRISVVDNIPAMCGSYYTDIDDLKCCEKWQEHIESEE